MSFFCGRRCGEFLFFFLRTFGARNMMFAPSELWSVTIKRKRRQQPNALHRSNPMNEGFIIRLSKLSIVLSLSFNSLQPSEDSLDMFIFSQRAIQRLVRDYKADALLFSTERMSPRIGRSQYGPVSPFGGGSSAFANHACLLSPK